MSVSLREKKLANGCISYYLDISHLGQRYYETLNIHTKPNGGTFNTECKKLAEQIRDQRAVELASSDYQIMPKHRQNTNFTKYYEAFNENYKKSDLRMHKRALQLFIDFIDQDKDYKDKTVTFKTLNTTLIKRYMVYLESSAGLSGDTPHDYFARFKRLLKHAKEQNIIKSNPSDGLSIKLKGKHSLKKQILTKEELQVLVHTPCSNNESKRAFLFACFSGFGYAELKKLKWGDIQNDKVNTYREKTGNQVWNKLNKTALTLLGERDKPETLIFTLPSDTAVNKAIKKWVKLGGIDKHVSFYCGRHAYACLLLTNGVNLKTVADLMGHSTTQHTVKYLNYVDELKEEAIDKLPNLNL